jgi:hypothetical protein
MNSYVLTLDPSGAGNGCLSTRVMRVFLNKSFLAREYAVDKPKTPLPIMRMDGGTIGGVGDIVK